MSDIKEVIKYWSQGFLLPIYLLSHIVSRDKKIWVIGSTFGRRFADNPKYFYLYLNQYKKEEVRTVWISKNKRIVEHLNSKGYEAYYYRSFKGIIMCLRGGVYLYDNYSKDISFFLSGNAQKINMWHGIPLKKINYDNKFDLVRHPQNTMQKLKWSLRRLSDEKPGDYVLTTSKFLKPIFSSAFRTKKVLVAGYPRNDVLLCEELNNILTAEEEQIWERMEKTRKGYILYMPTFRDSEEKLLDVINIHEFEQFLKNQDLLFCIKLHPKSKIVSKIKGLKSNNIIVIPHDHDPYIYVKKAKILITDYSSIYFDFLLLDRPIIFFNYDLEEYLSNTRELYFNYEEYTPGVKAKNGAELQSAILSVLSETEYDSYAEQRWMVRNQMFDYTDGLSSERLFELIMSEIER